MDWAGKFDDAFRLADQVFNSGTKDPELLKESSAFLASISYRKREGMRSMQYFKKALEFDPNNPIIHLQLGLMLLKDPFKDFEVAGAHLLLSTESMPDNDVAHLNFGRAMINRERYYLAYPSLRQAVLLYPNSKAKALLKILQEELSSDRLDPIPAALKKETYQSGVLSKIVQVRPDAKGREISDGIWTEWHENGMLKSLIDYEKGVRHGIEMKWNPDGKIISKARYLRGKLVENIGIETTDDS